MLSCAARPNLPALPGSSEDRVKEGESLLSAVGRRAGSSAVRLLQAAGGKAGRRSPGGQGLARPPAAGPDPGPGPSRSVPQVYTATVVSNNWDRHPAKNEIKAR